MGLRLTMEKVPFYVLYEPECHLVFVLQLSLFIMKPTYGYIGSSVRSEATFNIYKNQWEKRNKKNQTDVSRQMPLEADNEHPPSVYS